MQFTRAKLEHAAIIAIRNFTTWLGGTQIALNISFAKSLETAAIAALVSGITDLVGHK